MNGCNGESTNSDDLARLSGLDNALLQLGDDVKVANLPGKHRKVHYGPPDTVVRQHPDLVPKKVRNKPITRLNVLDEVDFDQLLDDLDDNRDDSSVSTVDFSDWDDTNSLHGDYDSDMSHRSLEDYANLIWDEDVIDDYYCDILSDIVSECIRDIADDTIPMLEDKEIYGDTMRIFPSKRMPAVYGGQHTFRSYLANFLGRPTLLSSHRLMHSYIAPVSMFLLAKMRTIHPSATANSNLVGYYINEVARVAGRIPEQVVIDTARYRVQCMMLEQDFTKQTTPVYTPVLFNAPNFILAGGCITLSCLCIGTFLRAHVPTRLNVSGRILNSELVRLTQT